MEESFYEESQNSLAINFVSENMHFISKSLNW